MSNNEESRIDRLEALAEQILQRTESNAKSIEALTNAVMEDRKSNAKSIEALTNSVIEDRKKAAQDRRHVFEWMSRLAAAQADFYELQADHINRLDQIEEKQTQMQTQILEMQTQVLDILDRLVKKG